MPSIEPVEPVPTPPEPIGSLSYFTTFKSGSSPLQINLYSVNSVSKELKSVATGTLNTTAFSAFAFSSSFDGWSTQSFAIGADGGLTLINTAGSINAPGWFTQSEDSQFVFTVAQGGSLLVVHEVNATTGALTEVDRMATPNTWPDYVDARGNGTLLYFNASNRTAMARFDRTTKKITAMVDNISGNPYKDWFVVGKKVPFVFMKGGPNLVNAFEFNEDGTPAAVPAHTFTGETQMKEIELGGS